MDNNHRLQLIFIKKNNSRGKQYSVEFSASFSSNLDHCSVFRLVLINFGDSAQFQESRKEAEDNISI